MSGDGRANRSAALAALYSTQPVENVRPADEPSAGRIDPLQPHPGTLMRHAPLHDRFDRLNCVPADGLTAGQYVADMVGPVQQRQLDFNAQSLLIDNQTGYVLYVPEIQRFIPASASGVVIPCVPAPSSFSVQVVSGNNTAAGRLTLILTERIVPPASLGSASSGGGGGGAVTVADGADVALGSRADVAWTVGAGTVVAILKAIVGKLAGTLTATLTGALPAGANAIGTVGVTALPSIPAGANLIGLVEIQGSTGNFNQGTTSLDMITAEDGAPVGATSQVAITVADSSVLVANPKRKQCLIVNHDTANPVFLSYTNAATTANGARLAPGASVVITFKGIVRAIATGGTVTLGLAEESWN
jgi:hypothetical protein